MRRLFFFSVTMAAVCGFIGCKKESSTSQSGSILWSYKDSMNEFTTTYVNGKLNALLYSDNRVAWNFEYKENYVKASSSDQYTEYFLNSAKLPTRISQYNQGSKTGDILFHYNAGTNLLDSVVSVNTYSWSKKDKYTFVYSVENISQVTKHSVYQDGTTDSFATSYTYSSVPNIFRSSDPLLYIYINPAADLSYHNMLFYFPKVFSSATFETYSIYPAWSLRQGMLHYTLNNQGKMTKEWYDVYGYPYEYSYK